VSTPYVVVVDDDEVIRKNIIKRLSRLNCHVRSFESGEAVVEFFAHEGHDPDIILLDYQMGGMNGVETLRRIRNFTSVPAVIFTAYSGRINSQEVEKLGSCEVMVKTVDLHTLDSIVNVAMAIKNLRNQEIR
jgi:CheY-like chemotaxis protein